MLTFRHFSPQDMKELLIGYNESFLRMPLKNPTKSLIQYVPKGFRPNKLSNDLLLKMYVDAIVDGYSPLTDYVLQEAKKNLEQTGIADIIKQIKEGDPESLLRAVYQIDCELKMVGFNISADLTLLLSGVKCPKDIQTIAQQACALFKEKTKDAYEKGKRHGIENAEKAALDTIDAEQRKILKQKGILEDERENHRATRDALTSCKDEVHKVQAKLNELIENEIPALQEDNRREKKNLENAEKQIQRLRDDSMKKDLRIQALEQRIHEQEIINEELLKKDLIIDEMKIKLKDAETFTFSAEVIRSICIDALDELRANSLSGIEIFGLAKEKFNENTTIPDAWQQISNDSTVLVEKLVKAFSEKQYSEDQLDVLDDIENDILIKYLIVKSLRAILFRMLENDSQHQKINDKF